MLQATLRTVKEKGFTVNSEKSQRLSHRAADLADLRPSQRRLLVEKVHIQPGADRRLPSQAPFLTAWGGGIHLVSLLGDLPDALLGWWASQSAGHIVLTTVEASYLPGAVAVGSRTRAGVARIPLTLIAKDPLAALSLALYPLDHLLGCRGDEAGHWLSAGGGIAPAWMEIGRQIHSLFELGYGISPEAQKSPQAYLAQGLVIALHDARQLNTADPKLDRLLHGSLLNEGFCRRTLP